MPSDSKLKHGRGWFEKRVGQYLIRNGQNDLFNQPVLIHSKGQAFQLYLTQAEKNYTYDELKTNNQ